MLKKIIAFGTAFALVMLAFYIIVQQAQATIDTTGSDIGNISAFGSPNTTTYGQTFTASEPDTILNEFSLYLRTRDLPGSGPLNLRGYIAGWDGFKASSILCESTTQTMNSAGNLQEFMFDTGGLNLVDGDQYVAFINISGLVPQGMSMFGMPNSGDVMPGGTFVFDNNGF